LKNRFMAAVKSHPSFPALLPERERIALQITSHTMRGAGCERIRPAKTFPCFIEFEYNDIKTELPDGKTPPLSGEAFFTRGAGGSF
jgi:hypothetical protein